MISKAMFHLAPLTQNEYSPLPTGAIRPRDWLKEELSACLSGITERLSESIDETVCLFDAEKALLFAYHMDAVVLLSAQMQDEELQKLLSVIEQGLANSDELYFEYWRWFFKHARKQTRIKKEARG